MRALYLSWESVMIKCKRQRASLSKCIITRALLPKESRIDPCSAHRSPGSATEAIRPHEASWRYSVPYTQKLQASGQNELFQPVNIHRAEPVFNLWHVLSWGKDGNYVLISSHQHHRAHADSLRFLCGRGRGFLLSLKSLMGSTSFKVIQ